MTAGELGLAALRGTAAMLTQVRERLVKLTAGGRDIDAHQVAVRRYANLEARLRAAQALADWADADPAAREMADLFAADFALEALHTIERHAADFALTAGDIDAALPAGTRAAWASALSESRFRALAERAAGHAFVNHGASTARTPTSSWRCAMAPAALPSSAWRRLPSAFIWTTCWCRKS